MAISVPGSTGRLLETLESVFLAYEGEGSPDVTCCITGGGDAFLGAWRKRVSVKLLAKPKMRSAHRMKASRRRFHDNMWSLSLFTETEGGLVLCQDDLLFVDGWNQKILKMVSAATEYMASSLGRSDGRFVIALSLDQRSQHAGECIFVSGPVIEDLVDAMEDSFIGRCPPFDRWLSEWCMSTDTPVLCGVPSVARPHPEVSDALVAASS